MAETIQELVDRFEPYLTPESGTFDVVRPSLVQLTGLYENDPWRSYHNVQHLEEMAEFLVANENELRDPTVVFGAVLGHDSVYEPWLYGGGTNEELSLERTDYFLSPHYAPWVVGEMGNFIRATAKHPTDINDTDLAYFLDADMRILGADEERFNEYEQAIYEEFTWLGAIARKEYIEGRLKFFEGVKNRRIFITEMAQDLYEAQAHRNIGAMTLRHLGELE